MPILFRLKITYVGKGTNKRILSESQISKDDLAEKLSGAPNKQHTFLLSLSFSLPVFFNFNETLTRPVLRLAHRFPLTLLCLIIFTALPGDLVLANLHLCRGRDAVVLDVAVATVGVAANLLLEKVVCCKLILTFVIRSVPL